MMKTIAWTVYDFNLELELSSFTAASIQKALMCTDDGRGGVLCPKTSPFGIYAARNEVSDVVSHCLHCRWLEVNN